MATLTAPPATLTPFATEPFLDFSLPENRRAMEAALAQVATELNREYDLVIGGKRHRTSGKIVSTNPANLLQVVGIYRRANASHVEPAIATLAFHTVSQTPLF